LNGKGKKHDHEDHMKFRGQQAQKHEKNAKLHVDFAKYSIEDSGKKFYTTTPYVAPVRQPIVPLTISAPIFSIKKAAKSESSKSITIIQKYLSKNSIMKAYLKVLEEFQELLRSKQVHA
jgi:hypothetical protein